MYTVHYFFYKQIIFKHKSRSKDRTQNVYKCYKQDKRQCNWISIYYSLFRCRDVAPSDRSDLLHHKMTLSLFSITPGHSHCNSKKTSVLLHQCEAAEHTNLEFRTKRYFVPQNYANTGFVSLYRGQLFIMAVSHGQLSVMGYESLFNMFSSQHKGHIPKWFYCMEKGYILSW